MKFRLVKWWRVPGVRAQRRYHIFRVNAIRWAVCALAALAGLTQSAAIAQQLQPGTYDAAWQRFQTCLEGGAREDGCLTNALLYCKKAGHYEGCLSALGENLIAARRVLHAEMAGTPSEPEPVGAECSDSAFDPPNLCQVRATGEAYLALRNMIRAVRMDPDAVLKRAQQE